jgi:c-di-AMP phosphodiesterase-like protein
MNNVFVRHSDLIKYIEGVDFTFVIAETDSDPKYYELSFRSKTPDFNVCEIAELFGGGGHKTGAGAKLYNASSIEEALNIVLNKLMLF